MRGHYKDNRPPYDRTALIKQSADRIIAGMRKHGADRVVFIIKGFNNSYESSDSEYEWMREGVLGERQAKGLFFVNVYWDAIYKGKGTAPMPVAYFADSMTYSNHAGDCGLRDLLRLMPNGTNVTFLTHSRGAAVALSALSDPKYDRHISQDCKSTFPGHEYPDQLGDVRLVAFAPAIGDGHVRESKNTPVTETFNRLDRFYVGYNPNDPAVTKKYFGINLADNFAGDTRLGGNEGYVANLDKILASQGLVDEFQFERFERRSHDWPQYIVQWSQARCLLWAGKLIEGPAAGCQVYR